MYKLTEADIFYLYFSNTSLPDIMAVLPIEQVKLLSLVIGGTNFVMPPIQDLKNGGRDFNIFRLVSEKIGAGKKQVEAFNEVSEIYNCSPDLVSKIYKNLKQYETLLQKQIEDRKKIG